MGYLWVIDIHSYLPYIPTSYFTRPGNSASISGYMMDMQKNREKKKKRELSSDTLLSDALLQTLLLLLLLQPTALCSTSIQCYYYYCYHRCHVQ